MLSPAREIGLFFVGWLACTAASLKIYAQGGDESAGPYFDHISTQQGLSANEVTALYRDTRGFLWIGTRNGLNEYDGRNIKVYHHDRFDNHSLIANAVNSIAEDDSGYLWIGTNEGISRFDPYSGQSINYSHNIHAPFSLNDNYNCHVYFDQSGTLWVGNESGVSYFNRRNNRFIHIQILPDSLNKTTLTSAGAFLKDRRGRFWIGTYSGLVLYDRKTHLYKRYLLSPDHKKGNNAVTTIFQDHTGRIWAEFWGTDSACSIPQRELSEVINGTKKRNMPAARTSFFPFSNNRRVHPGIGRR